MQLPPSLAFVHSVADSFFIELRQQYAGHVVLEPRHESWLDAERLLIHHRIARAAVDPSRVSHDALPEGWPGLKYWRLQGSPRTYFSPYELPTLQSLAITLQTATTDSEATWCMFDNTASGAALGSALTLSALLRWGGQGRSSAAMNTFERSRLSTFYWVETDYVLFDL